MNIQIIKHGFTVGLLLLLLVFRSEGYAQVVDGTIRWECILKRKSPEEAEIVMKAHIPEGWQLYALGNNADSPIKMTFDFAPSASYKRIGVVMQPQPLTKYDSLLGISVRYFKGEVDFRQEIRLTGKKGAIKGTIAFMQCSDQVCLPPQTIAFNINPSR